MEFAPILFFSFWSLVSIVFSAAGMSALHKATIPVPDGVIDYCVALPVNFTLVYAFLFGPVFQVDEEFDNRAFWKFYNGLLVTLALPGSGINSLTYFKPPDQEWNSWDRIMEVCVMVFYVWPWYACAKFISAVLKFILEIPVLNIKETVPRHLCAFIWEAYPSHLCWIPLQGLFIIFLQGNPIFKHCLLNSYLAINYFFAKPIYKHSVAPYLKTLIGSSSIAEGVYKHRKMVEIACGILATTVAQYYFRVQSVALMLAFLCLALAWLGTLAILQPCTDAGIFEFFVSSSMQSAVSLFGLHFHTILVVFGGILLWFLKLEMESIRKLGRFNKTRSWEEMLEINGGYDSFQFQCFGGFLFYYSRFRGTVRLFCRHISNTQVNRVQGVPRLNV